MTKLELSVAVGDYDRTRPLTDGRVQIDGVNPVFLMLSPEEMFFRSFRHQAFDVAELSLSSFLVKEANGENDYVGIPVFLSRAFRHNAIYVRKDRIKKPEDLKGKRVGLPEYQLTANVWVRAILEDDYSVRPQDITWVQGGIDDPDRTEKIILDLPEAVKLTNAPAGTTISELLARGDLDGFIGPRPPAQVALNDPNVGWLFDDPIAAAKDYYERTEVFPIMHILGVRKSLVEKHPWLPATLLKAFTESKEVALAHLLDTSASKATLPFVEEQIKSAQELMGKDYWSYGVDANRSTLETFVQHHYSQGLSSRKVDVDELFHPSTYEVTKI